MHGVVPLARLNDESKCERKFIFRDKITNISKLTCLEQCCECQKKR